ncbi:MAG: phosphoglycerate kinase [Erysipelotrichaceae bacterium]|nr:phosphoglycerate kinase [Erysipelotrichaceae bacterium]
MSKLTLRDLDVSNKKVIVRVDFNVPIKNGVITDDNRIVQALPTINYLLEKKAKLIIMSHLGKVDHKDPEKTASDKAKNNMAPVATRLGELVDAPVTFVSETRGPALEAAVNALQGGDIVVVQNTRYEKGESKNDPELAAYWASLGEVFVFDAFGSSHRAHATTHGIAEILPSGLGFLVEKEVVALEKAILNPAKPFVAIVGGAKVSDKIAVIENLLNIADKVLIGGGMAYTFLKALGFNIGSSLLEADKVELAKEFLDKSNGKLVLPVDHIVADAFSVDANTKVVGNEGIEEGWMGLDIGPETVKLFSSVLDGAKTVVWNGPMGVFELAPFANGTLEVCKAIAAQKGAMTVIGGGDSAAAAIQLGFKDEFSHISTGGGASLEFMEGKVLPGIAVIKERA